MSLRLGVEAALVAGRIIPGDVAIDPRTGLVSDVGLSDGAGSGLAVPGLVDLQINGFAGVEFRSAGADGYATAAHALAARGVTALQPTYFSQSIDDYEQSLRTLAEVHRDPPFGPVFLPAHLEGPFMSQEWKGAHQAEFLIDPDLGVADRLLGAGPVGFMTLAPELPGALEIIGHLTRCDVVVSLGHTDATAAQTRDAIAVGARHLTHCWNAHRRLTSRDPGPAGVALAGPGLAVGLIADLAHVSAEIILLTMRSAPGRVAATTDAIPFAGAGAGAGEGEGGEGEGQLRRGGRVRVVDGAAQLSNGTLAGGMAGPDDCLRNLVALGVDIAVAVDACGGVQRRLLGHTDVLVRPGDRADIAVFDADFRPRRTLVGGREVWAA